MSEQKEFIEYMRQKLEDWDYQRDRLMARIGDLRDEWQQDAKERLADFEARRKELESDLKRLEEQGEAAWEDLKDGVELAWDGLKTGLLAARSEFEGKDQ